MSNNNMNNFMPLPGSRRTSSDRRAFNVYTFDNSDSNEVPVFYRSRSNHNTGNRNLGTQDQWRLSESRTPSFGRQRHRTAPVFQAQPQNRQQFHFHNGDIGRSSNPRFRENFPQSPPRTATTTEVPPLQVVNSESMVLSKLRKEVYNPVPKRLARRLSLYYRGNSNNGSNGIREREKEKDEEGKSCAVCLEDFEAKEEVMVTPCNHMFHEGCIVPWVTSKGQCPVCRFVIIERVRGNNLYSSSFNSSNIANLEPSELIAGELLSILRAMEEAFQLGNGMHY